MLWLLLAHRGSGSATLINYGKIPLKIIVIYLVFRKMSENENRILEMNGKLENLVQEVSKDLTFSM
jgi:hypothetical protein